MAHHSVSPRMIEETHKVYQSGAVYSSLTFSRRITVRDILEFADMLREVEAPLGLAVEFTPSKALMRESMLVEWQTRKADE